MPKDCPEPAQKFYKGFEFSDREDGKVNVKCANIGNQTVFIAKNRLEGKIFIEEHEDDRLFLILAAKKLNHPLK
jgi:hypothetical protein